MALDFQQVRQQIRQLGEQAVQHQQDLKDKRQRAQALLEEHANQIDELRQRVQLVARLHDPSIRCAMPVNEPLDQHTPLPGLPAGVTVLAADGSQIFMDRHLEVQYCLVNVGAIQMQHGAAQPPVKNITSKLFYHDQLYTMTDASLALRRDLDERRLLAELAGQAPPPVITFTDGPMELWGSKLESGEEASLFQESLEQYLEALENLCSSGVTTAGYVDKPGADLVVRLLEVMDAEPADLPHIRKLRPLRGVTDIGLYRNYLQPGERSAVFALQSQSAKKYQGQLGLHFFYLNVGREGHPYLARVEVPAWVAESRDRLDSLHAVLVYQCRMMGARPYPYLLHRAHETAVVSREEQEQVTEMIAIELRRRGIDMEERSYKQVAKDQPGRTRYQP